MGCCQVKKIDRRLKACHAVLAKHGSPGGQSDADGRQVTLAAAVQRKVRLLNQGDYCSGEFVICNILLHLWDVLVQETHDNEDHTNGSKRLAEAGDLPQKRARVESLPA